MSPNVNMTPHKQNVLSAATTIPIYSGHSTSGCPIFRGEFIAFIMFFFYYWVTFSRYIKVTDD